MNTHLTTDITVKVLLDRYPELLQLFMNLKLLCVGCPTEAFHTIEDVAKEYGHNPIELIQDFQRFIDASKASAEPKQ